MLLVCLSFASRFCSLMLYGELPGPNCNLTRIITIKVRFQAINSMAQHFWKNPPKKNTRHMTSPLGHHTIGHIIIIFCTNDRLWLGVGPVLRQIRQTLNCTNCISSYHKEVFFSWATMHQFNVIFEVPVNSFARHVVIAQAWPKIPQHQMAVTAWRTAATRLLPFLSQRLEVNRWNPHVQNTWAEFVQLDGKRISQNVWSSMNLNLSIFSCR